MDYPVIGVLRSHEVKESELVLYIDKGFDSGRGYPHRFNLSGTGRLPALDESHLVVGIFGDSSQDNYSLAFFRESPRFFAATTRLALSKFLKKEDDNFKYEYCKDVLAGREVPGYDRVGALKAGKIEAEVKV